MVVVVIIIIITVIPPILWLSQLLQVLGNTVKVIL